MANHLSSLFALLAVAASGSLPAHAAGPNDPIPAFFDAALCKPPYDLDTSTGLYNAAEKLAKPDTSSGAAIYKVTQEIGRDGFSSHEVMFAGTATGVLIEGQVADALAARYQLKPESSSILGTSTKGYARAMPGSHTVGIATGTVSIVARESNALPGKTMLTCEFVSDDDRQALEAYEKSNQPK